METNTGILFDIQRFCVHDGNGIRTNVFFKGCPLRCDWCSNPESQKPAPQPLFEASKCIGCGACEKNCPSRAISGTGGRRVIDTASCDLCETYECVSRCYARALKIAGRRYTVEEVVRVVKKDRPFYRTSGGGVTLSGGEPLVQIEFAAELLKECREQGIHTAVETCGAVPWPHFERILPYADMFLFDVKHTDAERMKKSTGNDGRQSLDNLRKLASTGAGVTARVPVIPGFNSEPAQIGAIGHFVKECRLEDVELLAYHEMGVPKYAKTFCGRHPEKRQALTEEQMQERVRQLLEMGLRASAG